MAAGLSSALLTLAPAAAQPAPQAPAATNGAAPATPTPGSAPGAVSVAAAAAASPPAVDFAQWLSGGVAETAAALDADAPLPDADATTSREDASTDGDGALASICLMLGLPLPLPVAPPMPPPAATSPSAPAVELAATDANAPAASGTALRSAWTFLRGLPQATVAQTPAPITDAAPAPLADVSSTLLAAPLPTPREALATPLSLASATTPATVPASEAAPTGLDPASTPAAGTDDLDALATLFAAQDDASALATSTSAQNAADAPAPLATGAAPAAPLPDRAPPLPAVLDPRQPQAPQQLAESVVWHLGEGAQEVRLQLNPQELGALDIKLKLDGERVSVRFDMADASVRDVVQTSLPQLATLLSARGLQLDQAQVFTQAGGNAPWQTPQPRQDGGETRGEGTTESALTTVTPRVVLRRGLVDDYA